MKITLSKSISFNLRLWLFHHAMVHVADTISVLYQTTVVSRSRCYSKGKSTRNTRLNPQALPVFLLFNHCFSTGIDRKHREQWALRGLYDSISELINSIDLFCRCLMFCWCAFGNIVKTLTLSMYLNLYSWDLKGKINIYWKVGGQKKEKEELKR